MNNQQQATLYIFSGLPARGKSTLAKNLASTLQAQWLRVDTVEQTLKNQNINDFYDAGYQVIFALAADNLSLGLNVVADSSNPIEASRSAWREVAQNANCQYREIEVICSDQAEHKRRAETRKTDITHLKLPSWQNIQERHYQPWNKAIIQIDTAGKTIAQTIEELISKL